MSDPQQYKLPQRLEHDFDRKIIRKFREYDKIQRKIAAFSNHLHFTMHCKHHGVFPPSLTIKCSMHGPNVDKILHRTQRALLNERITRIKSQIKYYKDIRSDLDEYLFCQLPANVYTETQHWMTHAHTTAFNRIRSKQQQKFACLKDKLKLITPKDTPIVATSTKDKEELQSKWVVNVSKRNLAPEEVSLLKKGLKYAVTPSSIPMEEYVIGIESACRILNPYFKQAETLRADCVKILKHANTPKSNISKNNWHLTT